MSDKVSALTEITYPVQDTDVIYIIRAGVSYQGSWGELFQGFMKFVPGYEGYIILPATGNIDGTIVQEDDILVGKGAYFGGDAVVMRALQDSPTLDAHFIVSLSGAE